MKPVKYMRDAEIQYHIDDINNSLRVYPESENVHRYLKERNELEQEQCDRKMKRELRYRNKTNGIDPLRTPCKSKSWYRARARYKYMNLNYSNKPSWDKTRQDWDAIFSIGYRIKSDRWNR